MGPNSGERTKYILGFPGQGSQFVGGEDLVRKSPEALVVFKTADQELGPILGHSISVHCFEDPTPL